MQTTALQDLADEELIGRLAVGSHEAFELLHRRYSALLTHLASRQVERSSADEIAQDVLVSVWQHAGSFDSRRGRFRPWMLQIARRRIINELRRRRARPGLLADPDGVLLDAVADGAPGVPEQVARDERRSEVRCAVCVLPQPQREAVAMAFLQGMTQQEVASALDVPLGTTKTRIRTGLLRLRAELASCDVAA
jgi:RNA polymerase sigma factor (sigma-70 family)